MLNTFVIKFLLKYSISLYCYVGPAKKLKEYIEYYKIILVKFLRSRLCHLGGFTSPENDFRNTFREFGRTSYGCNLFYPHTFNDASRRVSFSCEVTERAILFIFLSPLFFSTFLVYFSVPKCTNKYTHVEIAARTGELRGLVDLSTT